MSKVNLVKLRKVMKDVLICVLNRINTRVYSVPPRPITKPTTRLSASSFIKDCRNERCITVLVKDTNKKTARREITTA